jgi:dihydroorotate dehydrogenase electron transfer subunit
VTAAAAQSPANAFPEHATPANPLAARYCADAALHLRATVIENVAVACATYRLRLACPEVASRIVPGQFVMIRLAGSDDPLLARPLALYDTWFDEAGVVAGIDVVYLVLGRMTRRLARVRPGDTLELWGPLGNGFTPRAVDRLIMVAGGIGQTPFLALGREALGGRQYGSPARNAPRVGQATLCYGVRTRELLAGENDFRGAGIDLRISSDDGSVGHRGLVTELLSAALGERDGASCQVVCCGPERMMEAVAELTAARGVACEVSLETPMACGVGICFSCVAKVRQADGTWDYKRTCVEGPVFDAKKIVW